MPEHDLEDLVQLVYCPPTTSWYTINDRGAWIKATETRASQILREAGFSPTVINCISPLNVELNRRMRSKDVDFAGCIAGWKPGVHTAHGKRFLVTDSPQIPAGKAVPWENLRGVLEGLLGAEQFQRFLCWLHFRRKSLLENEWLAGQAMVLMGPRGAGKSFTQHVVSMALGKRVAKPWRYMTGASYFNLDLIGAEHLCVEDDAPSHDIRTRRSVGNAIKVMLYARTQSAHGKGLQAVTLEPRWAMTVSINDEPENIAVIPPLDESLEDKITILKCSRPTRQIPSGMTEKSWLESILLAELAGLLHHIDHTEVPAVWKDDRSGVVAYQHPEAIAILKSISPEASLLALIDEHIRELPWWEGTAESLEHQLRGPVPEEIRRLTKWPHAIAAYLGRLAKNDSQRFQLKRTRNCNLWRIMPSHMCGGVEPPVEG